MLAGVSHLLDTRVRQAVVREDRDDLLRIDGIRVPDLPRRPAREVDPEVQSVNDQGQDTRDEKRR